MIVALLIALGLLCFFCDNRRFWPVAIFLVPSLMFQLVVDRIPDEQFHLSAASLDLVVIVLLMMQSKVNRLSVYLGVSCVASIALNFVGWAMFEAYMAPDIYNYGFSALYGAVIMLVLLCKDTENGIKTGGDRVGVPVVSNNGSDASVGTL